MIAFSLHIDKLKIKLDTLNTQLDQKLIKIGLKREKNNISHFERELPTFIQEFLINYGAGITLEQSLQLSLKSHCKDESLTKLLHIKSSAVDALNRFAFQQDRKEVWRFVRLVNQIHLTGAITSITALEKYHDELWQYKITKARMKSEKVTIILTFLLMLSLISVIIVVLTPVMFML